jgi:hypothetical protein
MFNGVKTILTMSIYHKDLSFTQVLRGEEGKSFSACFVCVFQIYASGLCSAV